jgi:hypothetical protein
MRPSTIRSPLSPLEQTGDQLASAVKQRLVWFCRRPALHARFLNTLSLLEHIGSRKIMKSRAGEGLSGEILRHLAEETRHAYVFKHAAEKLARGALGYGAAETIAGAAARAYMGRLDASITRECNALAESPLPYLYMSLIVELRAVWFYRLYQAALNEHKVGISVKSVLAEEELHLDAMLARLADMDAKCTARVAQFQALEQQRFRILWGAVEDECSSVRLAAE